MKIIHKINNKIKKDIHFNLRDLWKFWLHIHTSVESAYSEISKTEFLEKLTYLKFGRKI